MNLAGNNQIFYFQKINILDEYKKKIEQEQRERVAGL